MSNMELVLNMFAEASTTEISKQRAPKTLNENKKLRKRAVLLREMQDSRLKAKAERKLLPPKIMLQNKKESKTEP